MAIFSLGSEALVNKFEPIPDKTVVEASIYEISLTKTGPNSKNPDQPQLEIKFKVTEEGKYQGREIAYQRFPLYLNGAAWKTAQLFKAAGVPVTENGDVDFDPENPESIQGKIVRIKVGVTKPNDQGNVFNEVRQLSSLKDEAPATKSSSPAATVTSNPFGDSED